MIAVKLKPLLIPALARYCAACARFCVPQVPAAGLGAYGPRGTGPTTLPWPSAALAKMSVRLSAQPMASRALALASGPVRSCSISAR